MKGRTPAPTTQKKVTGTLRASRENKREPQLAGASYQPAPRTMTAEGQAVWKVFCPLAASMGVLTEADLQTLERLCEVAAEVRRLTKVISEEGHTYSTEAGLIKAHPAVAMAADADRILPGEGSSPPHELVQRLVEIGYSGAVSVELHNPRLWRVPPRQFGEIAMTSLRTLLGQASM